MAAKESFTPATNSLGADGGRIVSLVCGDSISFLVFTIIGINSHKDGLTVANIVLTALPFIVAWFIISPFVGAFRRELATQPRKMASRTALSWLAAWPLSMLFRGIFVDHGVPPWTFMLIVLVVNMLFLVLWRMAFAWLKPPRFKRMRVPLTRPTLPADS